MAGKQKNIECIDNNETLTSLIECIYQFSHKLIKSNTEKEIYQLLVEDVPNQMGIVGYVMYKINPITKGLKRIASYGDIRLHGIEVLQKDESIRSQYGISTTSKDAVIIKALDSSSNNFEIISLGSEIIIPVSLRGVVTALIVGKYSDQNTLLDCHRKLWQAITSLAADAIVKLREKNELEKMKFQLEDVLEGKDADLGKIIDILSSKNSELKYYNEKQKELLQELHHRVTNNLQTISSIIRLYKYGNEKDSISVLKEIYNRVQILAIIYQNIYKSMENDSVEVDSFLHDMVSYLKSTSNETRVFFYIQSDISCLSFNVLISLGLFIAEVFYIWLEKAEANKTRQINFTILIKGSNQSNSLIVSIKDEDKLAIKDLINIESSENISNIMISGLVDQLEGHLNQGYDKGNYINLEFKP